MQRAQNWLESKLEIQKDVYQFTAALVGVFLMAVLAQVKIPLPFTPVPVTGQTFGLSFIALLYGRKLGFATIATYLFFGGLGAPVFQGFTSGLSLAPTLGYLIGMLFASYVVGALADRGYAKSFSSALACSYLGSAIIFTCGILGLSFFVPTTSLFFMGVAPFLLGDLLKNTLAAWLVSKAYN